MLRGGMTIIIILRILPISLSMVLALYSLLRLLPLFRGIRIPETGRMLSELTAIFLLMLVLGLCALIWAFIPV